MNQKIRAPEVRIIGAEGEQLGVSILSKALELAAQQELDLVEVASTAKPPVCRIMDFTKFKYDQEKREREARKHHKLSHLKEIRFKPKIEEHDYQTKIHHLLDFLKKGDKVKVTMVFRGRENAHREFGRRIIDRVIADSAEVGQVDRSPFLQGRMITTILVPVK
ncbi:MAG TPA: translation initiation factor IF-3 [Candidatus Omnitrophica bacterium]|nr:translation initiation factor IF-3 [Candidatus Omnitrophota bacterium]